MDIVAYLLAWKKSKKYTEDSLVGVGALKGSPCTIKSKTSITGGTRVTFAWEDTEGVEHTGTVDLMNGADGSDGADGTDGDDGVSVTGLSISGGHLLCTLSDGTSIDAGTLPSGGATIDDSTTALDKTWSSSKISDELSELSDSKVSLDKLSSDDFDVDAETGEISVIGGGGSGTSVVINPILSGDEETATSIKVGDEKYIFPNTNTYGFTPAQITMFEGILRAGTYSSDQSSAITAFIESLSGRPEIPNGYWQFKTTDPYKYVILGTDDSTTSDPYFYRLCRSYGFPYTCNVIADYMDRAMASDDIEGFTEDDAPSLFESAPTTREFLTACKDRTDIEFALHGSSAKHLVDSDKLTDDLWSTYYSAYTTGGGTKSLAEFKTAFLDAIETYDISQGASYVEESRSAIEDVIGKYVDTCGIWGGSGTTKVDGIELSISEIGSNNYAWRENGFTALGYYLVGQFTPGYVDKTEDYIRHLQRDSGGIGDFVDNYNRMKVGDCIELFHHYTDSANIASHKQSLATIKQYVDANKVRVVTRKQYAQLGEYVSNPIVSIDVTRTSATINVGDTDLKSNYTVVATYLDNTTADVTTEAIIELIDTSVAGVVNVPAYYRGLQDTVMVDVQSGGGSNVLEPTVLNNFKIDQNTFNLVTAPTSNNVYRYDVTGLSTIYLNSTKQKQYQQGWSDIPLSTNGDFLSNGLNYYYNPTNNPNEITVPEGMNYFYFFSTDGGDIDFPWTITKPSEPQSNIIEPIAKTGTEINSSGVIASKASTTVRQYIIPNGVTKLYFNCDNANGKSYKFGFMPNDTFEIGMQLNNYASETLIHPTNYEITVPTGMTVLYVYANGFSTNPWVVSISAIN